MPLRINKPVVHFENTVPEKVLVSVVVTCYNHEKNIEECLSNIVNQEVDFKYEIIVGEDESSDNSREICLEFAKKYPDKIRLLLHSRENQIKIKGQPSGRFNFLYNLYNCKGDYIALCEGDDHWCDKNKLAKQVEFLQSNQDYSFSFHKVFVKNEIVGINHQYSLPNKEDLGFFDIVFKHYVPTCSVVFRKSFIEFPLPDFCLETGMMDIPLELMLADKGRVKFFNEEMGVYRKNSRSVTQSPEQIRNGRGHYFFLYKKLNEFFNYKYFWIFTLLLLKLRVGQIKDILGLNPILRNR